MVDLPLDARILDLGGGAGGTSPKRTWKQAASAMASRPL